MLYSVALVSKEDPRLFNRLSLEPFQRKQILMFKIKKGKMRGEDFCSNVINFV